MFRAILLSAVVLLTGVMNSYGASGAPKMPMQDSGKMMQKMPMKAKHKHAKKHKHRRKHKHGKKHMRGKKMGMMKGTKMGTMKGKM